MAKRRRRRLRRRKNPSNATLVLLLAGGGAAAYYFLVHRRQQQVPIAPTPVAPPAPNIIDSVTGLVGGLLGSLAAKPSASQVAARIAKNAGSAAAVPKWEQAKAAGEKFFAYRPHASASWRCLDVATGNLVPNSNCPVTQLEGFAGLGDVRGTLSSRGYGSLR